MSTPPRSPRAPRSRSAFGAAFLSLVFPGLGHVYAGAWTRALAFAALPLLAIAALAGIGLRAERSEMEAYAVNPGFLNGLLVANVLAFLYRAAAAVDAWTVARFLNAADAAGGGRRGRTRLAVNPLSIAGLAAVLLVMAGAHVAIWHYDTLALSVVNCLNPETADPNCDAAATGTPNPSDVVPSDSGLASGPASDAPTPSIVPSDSGGGTPAPSLPPWDGTSRLNILLVGTDERPSSGSSANTDTMIVVSIDPKTKQIAMLQLPRDITGVPVPPQAQSVFGATFQGKINSWYDQNRNRTTLWPGKTAEARGFAALKAILGNLYGLNIQYYVKVNFQGFKDAVDTLGGVQINVQIPVADDGFPLTDQIKTRVYIPAGPQEMDGTQALVYARSRHTSSDFDRGARQQRVILSVKNQMDPQAVFANLNGLVAALKKSVKTDIPVGDTQTMGQLLQLASQVDTKGIRSYVFAPPRFATNLWPASSDIPIKTAQVRQAVKQAFSISPSVLALQDKLSAEGALVWVEDGKGLASHAANNVAYLNYFGIDASAPVKPASAAPSQTTITVYGDAQLRLPATIKYLQDLYKVTVKTGTDPGVKADIVIVLGPNGRDLPLPTAG
ncbi:MAG: LCP family protein [Candidatus Limnocylindrales bacterium]